MDHSNPTSISNDTSIGSSPLSFHLKLLATVFYSLSCLASLVGNITVIVVVLFYKPLKSVKSLANFYILHLAVADLTFALLCIPTTYFTTYIVSYWPFSEPLCVFFNYMQNVSVTLAIYIIILITIDKLWAIIFPFQRTARKSMKLSKLFILFTWAFALFVSMPLALFTKLIHHDAYEHQPNETNITLTTATTRITTTLASSGDNIGATATDTSFVVHDDKYSLSCGEDWPKKPHGLNRAYTIFMFLVQYLIPLVILTISYIKIGFYLKSKQVPGESIHSRDIKIIKSKNKIYKMCFCMVFIFMVSFFPWQILTIYRVLDYNNSLFDWKYVAELFFVSHVMAMSHSFANPIIYFLTNSTFRQAFRYYIMRLMCLRPSMPQHTRTMSTYTMDVTSRGGGRRLSSSSEQKNNRLCGNNNNNQMCALISQDEQIQLSSHQRMVSRSIASKHSLVCNQNQ